MQQTKAKQARYQVLAIPKSGHIVEEPYLIYDGKKMTREVAKKTADGCNRTWGENFTYEVIEAMYLTEK